MEQGLKLAVLKAACDAAEAAPFTNESLDADLEACHAADLAHSNELRAAHALQEKFFAEFNDAERDSGVCNARDTAGDYGLYAKHGDIVERSTEFWQCAIDSAQLMRDCG